MQQRTPPWLSGGPAAALFRSELQTLGGSAQGQQVDNAYSHLPMAARGSEIFYVVDNNVRWADLSRLKAQSESREAGKSARGYTALNLRRNFQEPIQQLVVSPNEELMAIVTKHSVSVVVLPDPSSWSNDDAPLPVKRHTIGETTHVKETSPVAKVLWHPLGVDGSCLVTITTSAVVRLWELDRRNLSSFSVPSLAIDLTKLRHARSQEEDVMSRDMNFNKTFSIDSVEMEVTGACFGSNANEAQAFEWSAATLWLTMAEGDIFALCPLLPSKFQPDDDGTISTLYELAAAQKESLEAAEVFGLEKARMQAQSAWLKELSEQYENLEEDESATRRVYYRPRSQGAVPRLQGPFVILPDQVQDELYPVDIHVIGATTAALLADEGRDEDDGAVAGTSFSTVAILGDDGRVYVCLDIDGVAPQWLPESRPVGLLAEPTPPAELVLFEALDTLKPGGHGQFPIFTANASADDYSFFVSHRQGMYKFSLEPWIHQLEKEVQAGNTQGVKFRTQVLSNGPGTKRERVLRPQANTTQIPMADPVLISSEEVGHLLLTVQDQRAYAVVFSNPGIDEEPAPMPWKPVHGPEAQAELPPLLTREPYQPPNAFSQPSDLPNFAENSVEPRYRRTLTEEVRLSSATLQIMTEAHRALSRETSALNVAAADLFRRCDRLHDEFKQQIAMISEVAERIKANSELDADVSGTGEAVNRKQSVEQRVRAAAEKQKSLAARHDALRQKLLKAGGKPLSGKERAWVAEVDKIQESLDDDGKQDSEHVESRKVLVERYNEVKELALELIEQAKKQADVAHSKNAAANGNGKVPPDIRRGKIAQVEGLLERETALLDAAMVKLGKMGLVSD